MREDLKFANEDVAEMTQQLTSARKEIGTKDRTIAMLQKDLGSRSEHDIFDDESHMQRVNELEAEVTEKVALVSELQDKLREIQDDCDELKAENERVRQKNIAQKRSMQKSYSLPNTRNTSAKKRYLSTSVIGLSNFITLIYFSGLIDHSQALIFIGAPPLQTLEFLLPWIWI